MKKIIACLLSLIMIIGTTAAVYAAVPADGSYSVSVSLEGGTGRVKLKSPCELTVQAGKMTARVVWGSSNYTWMKIGGVTYNNENSGGNSTFTIPVSALDSPISVSAETTAMSEPHVIDYTITFSSAGIDMNGEDGRDNSSGSTTSKPQPGDKSSALDKESGDSSDKDRVSEETDKENEDSNSISVINTISRATSVSAEMLSDFKGKTMHLVTSAGSVDFDEEALAYIAENASGSITLTMSDVTEKYKDEKYDLAVELSIKDEEENQLFTAEGLGKATVSLNYEKEVKNKNEVEVYRLTDGGKEKVESSYSEKTGTVTFETESFATYAVSEKAKTGTKVIAVTAAVLVAAAAVLCAAVIIKKKKKIS